MRGSNVAISMNVQPTSIVKWMQERMLQRQNANDRSETRGSKQGGENKAQTKQKSCGNTEITEINLVGSLKTLRGGKPRKS